jgi:hypothetical protein
MQYLLWAAAHYSLPFPVKTDMEAETETNEETSPDQNDSTLQRAERLTEDYPL